MCLRLDRSGAIRFRVITADRNIHDYLSAIDDVATEPWVDARRLGCVGASYGGYSVFYLAGHHQKRFKAFIAHCGMFNLESMYGATEELWFPNNDLGGPYWSDDTVARRSYANSPHRFVKNWDTPILIFSGQGDFRFLIRRVCRPSRQRVYGVFRAGW